MSDDKTTVVDGVTTTLPAEALKDLTPKDEAKTEEVKQAAKADAEPKAEPAKVEEPKAEVTPEAKEETKKPSKPKPIADLLAKKHEAEQALEETRAENVRLQAELANLSKKPATTTPAQLKALAEKYTVDENFLADMLEVVKATTKPESPGLPKEVQDLITAHKADKEAQAELHAYEARLASIQSTFKDEPIGAHKDKLMELAYSTEKAPDGIPYYQKELTELWFGYIKPTIEPGKKSAESTRGGTTQAAPVLDFSEIQNDPVAIEKMDEATWKKFQTWMQEHQKGSPMRRPHT